MERMSGWVRTGSFGNCSRCEVVLFRRAWKFHGEFKWLIIENIKNLSLKVSKYSF